MFARLARIVVDHPWRVVAVWIVGAVAVIAFSPTLASVTSANQESFLPSQDESAQALAVAAKEFPLQVGATGILVVQRADHRALTSSDLTQVGALVSRLQGEHLASVASVGASPALVSPNGKVALTQVAFRGQPGQTSVNDAVAAVRRQSDSLARGTGLAVGLTGNAAIQADTSTAFASAQTVIAVATIGLIVVLLGLIFRSVAAAVVPILMIGLVHLSVNSVVAVVARAAGFKVGTLLTPLLIVVLFGVGTDYVVFLLFRYRERLGAGDTPKAALRFATTAVGEVIGSSAITVIAAFAALFLSTLGTLRTLAPGLIIAVGIMLVAALTLVPAVFSILGSRLWWPARRHTPAGAKSYSARVGRLVGRHPAAVALVYGGVLVVIAVGALGYRANYDTVSELPTSARSVQVYDQLKGSFPPGALVPTQVFVESSTSAPLQQAPLARLAGRLGHVHGVASVLPAQMSADRRAALVNVVLQENPYSSQALDLVAGPVKRAAHGSVPGARVLVGGGTSTFVDVRAAIAHDLSRIFPVAAAVIALILGLLLRAVVAPLYLIAGVGLGYLATLGASTLVFQDGAGMGGLDFTIPVVLYLFVVAIGTDYNILMTSRLREEFRGGAEPNRAAALAIEHGAPTVAAAGVILAGTFASLLLTGIASLTELGFGVAAGIVISAFVMAPRLVPAVAALRGWRFWWPSGMQRSTASSPAHLGLHDHRRSESQDSQPVA